MQMPTAWGHNSSVPAGRKIQRRSNEQTFVNLQFEFWSYGAVIDHVACSPTTRLCIKLFFHSSIFTKNRKSSAIHQRYFSAVYVNSNTL
jgi:hypothetical protein